MDADDWEALVDWVETLEDRQAVREAAEDLKAAGGWADKNLIKTGTGTATNSGLARATTQDVAEPVPVFISPAGGSRQRAGWVRWETAAVEIQ